MTEEPLIAVAPEPEPEKDNTAAIAALRKKFHGLGSAARKADAVCASDLPSEVKHALLKEIASESQ